ncbi:Uncharacterised protein [Suttonella indologenes]|uniref:Uncharacterized protein n=1 Tax=Suttonella indologenes TaxID=13276 RepID=A0A380MWC3_9GAMM|nr:Uncharacterised protein [Suttonella indologenes]
MQKITLIHEVLIIIAVYSALMHVSLSHQKTLVKLFCLSFAFSIFSLYHLMMRDKLSPAFAMFKHQSISSEILLLIFSATSILLFILMRKHE